MMGNRYYMIVSSLLCMTSAYSVNRLSEEDSGDTKEPQRQEQFFSLKEHMHAKNVTIFNDGNYLIAVQELENNLKDNLPPIDKDSRENILMNRQKRSLDKLRLKLKGYEQDTFNSVLKRNEFRSTSPRDSHAVVDLLVIVDRSAYLQALNKNGFDSVKTVRYLETYYRLLVELINTRYEELKTQEFRINIRPADIMILKDKRSSAWVDHVTRYWENEEGEWEEVVDPQELLDASHEWLLKNVNSLPQHDHVMSFVGYRMVRRGRSSPSSGMAYVNTICQTQLGYSCSVIQETWGFGNAGAATHELGHSLGATHDGFNENKDCLAKHGYIMAPSSSPQDSYELNFFSFSPCSIEAFKKTLLSEQAECLYDSKPDRRPDVLPGELLTPEAQCKEVFGTASGQCQIANLQQPEEICQRLWCARPIDGDRVSCSTRGGLHAVYGTPCGADKVCYNGRCLHEHLITRQSDMNEDLLNSAEDNLESFQQHESYQNSKHGQTSRQRTHHDNKDKTSNEKTDDVIATTIEKQRNSPQTESPLSKVVGPPNAVRGSKSQETSVLDELQKAKQHKNRKINKGRARSSNRQNVKTTTEVMTTTSTTTSTTPTKVGTSCIEDKDQHYCRSMVYMHPAACEHAHIRDYCCFSCGFIG